MALNGEIKIIRFGRLLDENQGIRKNLIPALYTQATTQRLKEDRLTEFEKFK